jgi:hypothetical protein
MVDTRASTAHTHDDGSTTGRIPMATLDTKARDNLRASQFAYVDRRGGEHLPINDASHVRNAIARFNQTEFESMAARERARRKILSAAERHGIEVDRDDKIRKSARSLRAASTRAGPRGGRKS